ncbi:MAG: hypothetical protein AAFY73_13505 [Pseudomonadota bacterium]
MSALMEHDDFKSARRALIASSIALYVVADFSFLSSEIEFFSLRLEVNQEKIVSLGSFAVIYLIFVFLIRAFSNNRESQNITSVREKVIYENAIDEMNQHVEGMRVRMEAYTDSARNRDESMYKIF